MSDELRDRYRGALIGMAMGNSLGFLPEGRDRRFCIDFCQKWQRGEDLPIKFRQRFAFGQVTADVQLAAMTAETIIAMKNADSDDFIERFRNRPKGQSFVSASPSIRWLMWQLSKGKTYEEVISMDDTNAAIPRVIPIAMAFAGDTRRIIDESIRHIKVTHRKQDILISGALLALSVSVALTVSPWNLDPMQFLTSLRAMFYEISQTAFDILGMMQEWTEVDNDIAIIEAVNQVGGHGGQTDKVTTHAFPAILFGILCFLKHPTDILTAIIRAVSGGGASATSAAIAGCLCGAYLGHQAISDIRIPIKEKKIIMTDHLLRLADGLVEVRSSLYGRT